MPATAQNLSKKCRSAKRQRGVGADVTPTQTAVSHVRPSGSMDLPTAFRLIMRVANRAVRETRDLVRMERYRSEQESRGVTIHPDARLYEVDGIALGKGTVVYPDSTVAANSLDYRATLRSRPDGQITAGQNFSSCRGAWWRPTAGAIETATT